jgi:hypothetical protein
VSSKSLTDSPAPSDEYLTGMLVMLGYDRDSLNIMTSEDLQGLYYSAMDGHDPEDFDGTFEDCI